MQGGGLDRALHEAVREASAASDSLVAAARSCMKASCAASDAMARAPGGVELLIDQHGWRRLQSLQGAAQEVVQACPQEESCSGLMHLTGDELLLQSRAAQSARACHMLPAGYHITVGTASRGDTQAVYTALHSADPTAGACMSKCVFRRLVGKGGSPYKRVDTGLPFLDTWGSRHRLFATVLRPSAPESVCHDCYEGDGPLTEEACVALFRRNVGQGPCVRVYHDDDWAVYCSVALPHMQPEGMVCTVMALRQAGGAAAPQAGAKPSHPREIDVTGVMSSLRQTDFRSAVSRPNRGD